MDTAVQSVRQPDSRSVNLTRRQTVRLHISLTGNQDVIRGQGTSEHLIAPGITGDLKTDYRLHSHPLEEAL